MNRRRILAIAAAALVPPAASAASEPHVWTNFALGAEVRLTLRGITPHHAARTFAKVEAVLRTVEEHFSLYQDSALTRLNRTGRLSHPAPAILGVFRLCGKIHDATQGLFDPTVQPLWLAVASSGDTEAARRLVGWRRVHISDDEISLDPGMQLTFNGIAQGHAADEVAALLRQDGYEDVLIDTGEVMGLGKRPDGEPWRAAIALPDGTIVGRSGLSNRALATSSPLGTRVGNGKPHILDPRRDAQPVWRLAAVSAREAAVADGLSTAFCLMDRSAINRALACFASARLETLI